MPSFALLAEHTTFALLVDESGKDKEVAVTNSMSPTHATSARFARPDKSASHPLSTHPHPYSAKYTLTQCSCCMQEATGTLPKQGARSQLGWSGAHSG